MGTWGHTAFQNDGACDWAWEVPKSGLPLIGSAFDEVLGCNELIEAPQCENAIAAAETLCVLGKRPGVHILDDVAKWAATERKSPTLELIDKAKRSLHKILADSELKELWAESDEFAAWKMNVEDILSRLPEGVTAPKRPFWKFW